MVELMPKTCNICGGEVEFVPNTKIYGRFLKYGSKSGYCYHCKECGAVVGTHIADPRKALVILADENMRKLRQKNHDMFDKFWRNKAERKECYDKLAAEMGIPTEECHFGYFDADQLNSAYTILIKWWYAKYDR